MNYTQIRLLTNEQRLLKYAAFRNKAKGCTICYSKDCLDHSMILTLPNYSFDINPIFKLFVSRLRGAICTGCHKISVNFSQLRRKGIRKTCKICRSPLLQSGNKETLSFEEHESSVTDPTGYTIHLRDLCFGANMLTGPFMFKIPDTYLKSPTTLFGFIYRKRHLHSSLYSRVHRRDSWIRSQIVSRRTKYSSRCVITPSLDYSNAQYVYIPRIVARNRCMKDGDFVCINRHPTLHCDAFSVLKAKIWDKSTIGLHVASTFNMAADFDGDIINVMMLGSYEEQAEGCCLMYPENVFVNPPANSNILSVTQNMTYIFRHLQHLALLTIPVYFKCISFVYNHGICMSVENHSITRTHLNDFLTHVFYQLGPQEAVRVFNHMATLTHETLATSVHGVSLSHLLEFKSTPSDENLFLIQPRHGIKGDFDNVTKMLGNFSSNGYWMGRPTLAEKFEQAKIARSRLSDSVCLIAIHGWDYKKLAISLTDLTITYLGNVSIGKGKSLTHDLEFYFNYLCRSRDIKNALKFALLSTLQTTPSEMEST